MAFPFAKDPIAGIRPIEEMLSVGSMETARPPAPRRLALNGDPASLLPARQLAGFGDARMTEVATPISLSGFTSSAIDRFAPQLRSLGLEPRQGISLGGAPESRMGDPSKLQPGSMISVELMTGSGTLGRRAAMLPLDISVSGAKKFDPVTLSCDPSANHDAIRSPAETE